MKPTEQIAKSASTPKAGLSATLSNLLRSQGSGAPSSRRFALATITALLGALAFSTAPAQAARGHVFSTTFGSGPCTVTVLTPCEGKFKEPSGVAVNEETGRVYVLDQGNARVERFSSAGAYEAQFNGSETPATAFAFRAALLTAGIAVDNSCYFKKLSGSACSTADPSNGDVYVTDPGHQVVDKFSPEGSYLGQLQEASGGAAFKFELGPEEGNELDGVAVDANGTVWVYQASGSAYGEFDSFTNTEPSTFIRQVPRSGGGFRYPGFAVDSEDNLYARGLNVETGVDVFLVDKFSASGQLLLEPFVGEEASAVAVDLSSNEVFLDNVGSVGAFSKGGSFEERFGSTHLTSGSGLAVSHANGTVYVADSAADDVVLFGPKPPSQPTVGGESVSEVAGTSATFGAEINPRSESTEPSTEYRFQYGPCATPSTCATSPFQASTPVGSISPSFDAQSVSVHPQDLLAGTVYHFRVLATNSLGTAEGERNEKGEEVVHTFTTQTAGAFALPDNRQWELVSPPDKHGSVIGAITGEADKQAAASGGAMTYTGGSPTESGVQGYFLGVQILSTRGPGGWSSRDISLPHATPVGINVGLGDEYRFFSEDLSLGVAEPFGEFTSLKPEVFPSDTERTPYIRHDLTCQATPGTCFEPLLTGAAGYADVLPEGTKFGVGSHKSGGVRFVAGTTDLSHVVLESPVPLMPEAVMSEVTGGEELYEWSAVAPATERLQFVTVLPPNEGGKAVRGELGAGKPSESVEDKSTRHAISGDGSRIFWSTDPQGAGAEEEALYLRYRSDTGKGETVRLDAPEPGCLGKGECGEGKAAASFQIANSEGSRVFFTDTQRLTADSGAKEGKPNLFDLYECEITEVAGKLKCVLRDLTPAIAGKSASVQGGVLGSSVDGSYVYFVANGVLAPGATPGDCAFGGSGVFAPAGATCNLYVLHYDSAARNWEAPRLIGVLSQEDSPDWSTELAVQPTRVSPNGRYLAFMSNRSLTGYDNHDANSGKADEEVFLFDANDGRLVCASCNPTGARPEGVELAPGGGLRGRLIAGEGVWENTSWLAANIPGWTAIALRRAVYQSRYLSDEGRLFFNSSDALVPQDINHNEDVYEYEPSGIGSCSTSSSTFGERSDGCVGLISSGTSSGESAFLDASESGNDVFFVTGEKLVPQDIDTANDVYDAHVCGAEGVPCTAAVVSPPPCTTADACRSAPLPQPSIFGSGPTETFTGAGNPPLLPPTKVTKKTVKCKKNLVKNRKGKCVRKSKSKKAKGKKASNHRRVSK